MSVKDYTLMIKPVGSACNMRCAYCYYLNINISHNTFMSEETLEKLIKNYLSDTGDVASFVWHGGEPTLRGLSFYVKAVELQNKYKRDNQQVWNNLQTNGYALAEEWCRFLSENHFDVGLSIDGTEDIHNFYRKDAAGNDTYQKIRKNIDLLKKHGIRADLLCTVNSETSKRPVEVYETLRDMGTGWIQFIPVHNTDDMGNLLPESVGIKEYGDFLVSIFNRWIYKDLGKVNVQLFIEMINTLAGGEPSLCWLKETCGNVPVIEADGKVYSCDHFVNEVHSIGNIDTPVGELLDKDFQKDFGQAKKEKLSDKCRNCSFLKLCNGGCPKDRVLDTGDENPRYYYCESLEHLFGVAVPRIKELIELDRRKISREEIMKILLNNERKAFGKAGRNDSCPCGSGRKFKSCCFTLRP